MKKFSGILVLLLISAILLSSCGKKEAADEFIPQKSFTIHMTAEKNNNTFEADIICLNSEDITIAFTSPKELSGFSLKAGNGAYKAEIFGMEDELSAKEINNTSVINVLIKTIRTAAFTNHGQFIKKDGFYTAGLTIDGIPVTADFSGKGFLQKITAETLNFSAQFEISG